MQLCWAYCWRFLWIKIGIYYYYNLNRDTDQSIHFIYKLDLSTCILSFHYYCGSGAGRWRGILSSAHLRFNYNLLLALVWVSSDALRICIMRPRSGTWGLRWAVSLCPVVKESIPNSDSWPINLYHRSQWDRAGKCGWISAQLSMLIEK